MEKFMGDSNLLGKVFETKKVFKIYATDAMHHYMEIVNAIADYVGHEYTYGADIRSIEKNLEDFNYARLVDLPEANQYVEFSEYNPIYMILADHAFQAMKDEVEELGFDVNQVSTDENIPEVEHQNRVIKEKARAIMQVLLFAKIILNTMRWL
jgi:hypothetical protein